MPTYRLECEFDVTRRIGWSETSTVGVAIRAAGGKHEGLLSFGDEAHIKQDGKGFSALKSPTWLLRRAELKREGEL
jgi:hypothetical protein